LPSLYPGPEFCLDGAAYTATSVARAFFAEIVRLHGLPSSIVSDRDATFTSTFWRELFCLFGVHLNMSAAFHPQSHGQSEAVNKIITMYLRCLSGDRPHQWVQWLPWAKFCYNSAYQSSLQTTPFCAIYGRDPPAIPPYTPGAVRVPAVDQQLVARDEFFGETKDRLEQAQQHYKVAYDAKHRVVEFNEGDWVWLRLLQRPVASLLIQGRSKLGPKFFGPFRVLERISSIAYKLELPLGARLHNVFHVGLLKPYKGEPSTGPGVLPPVKHGRACA
jgi:hypothetical protein